MFFRLKHHHATTAFLCFSIFLAACKPITAPVTPAQTNETTGQATTAPTEEATTAATAEATTEPQAEATAPATAENNDAAASTALLAWQGDIGGTCTALTIQPDGETAVRVCGEAPSVTKTLAADNADWVAVQQQFGDINADTPAGKIVFHGQGNATSDEWAQALATWASFTAMEAQAGRTAAALRTALAWQLTDTAEHSGQCSQLVVLAYGYAYANLIPCTGSGNSTPIAMGWLIDSELDTFMDWINNGVRVEDKAGYLDAKGTKAITPEEIGNWANGIYNRMIQ